MKTILISLSIVLFVSCLGYGTYKAIVFDTQCKEYLSLAANANSIELAKTNLDKAIQYIEQNQLTSGNTAFFIKGPSTDLTSWYANLKACQKEVWTMDVKKGTVLEETNLLMKLRESLMSEGLIIIPENIALHPNQLQYMIGLGCSILFCAIMAFIHVFYHYE